MLGKEKHVDRLNVAELRMLRLTSSKTKSYDEKCMRNLNVTLIEYITRENHLRWFGHAYRIVEQVIIAKNDPILKRIENEEDQTRTVER